MRGTDSEPWGPPSSWMSSTPGVRDLSLTLTPTIVKTRRPESSVLPPQAKGAGDEHEGYGFEMNPMAITTASSKGGTRAEDDTEVEVLREQVRTLR